MKAEIISTGTELLLGQITDTNSPYLAAEVTLRILRKTLATQCVRNHKSRLTPP